MGVVREVASSKEVKEHIEEVHLLASTIKSITVIKGMGKVLITSWGQGICGILWPICLHAL